MEAQVVDAEMNRLVELVPVLTILCYIPFLCYMDIKSRRTPLSWWAPLIIVGVPSLYIYLLESPLRNFHLLGLTVVLCAFMFLFAAAHIIGGADFIFASLIMLFVQSNPFVFPREFFALDFFWTLWLLACTLPIIVWGYNTYKQNRYGLIDMFTKVPNHFPFMIVISAAFIITLVMEVLL